MFYHPSLIFASWLLPDLRTVLVASLLATAAGLSPAVADAQEAAAAQPQRRFREIVPWLPSDLLLGDKLVAFEEHAHFVYLASRSFVHRESARRDDRREARFRLLFLRPATLVADIWPFDLERFDIGKPAAMSTVEVSRSPGKEFKRAVCIYYSPARTIREKTESIRMKDSLCSVAITENDRTFHVELPLDLAETARIALESTDGQAILPKRHLPAGVMPYGPEGMGMIERWDSRYRGNSRPGWDKGFPSTHLKAAVANGTIKPVRAVVLGCGTGTNAIYLATKGFDVTAIDIAPTALSLAEKKADKAGVKVRWLLADVCAPPSYLEQFDFIFDRGCYHGVRPSDARRYVNAVKQLSRSGTHVFILAGNANEERHYGPPRVSEEELRGDFSSDFDFAQLKTVRFDSVDPQSEGALAWFVLLRRKAEKTP
jgi:SAM-dependent methyltransferase